MPTCPVCNADVTSRGMSKKTNSIVELFSCNGIVRHKLQGTLQHGHLHLFQSHPLSLGKNVYSVRLSDIQVNSIIATHGTTLSGRASIQKWIDDNLQCIPPIPSGE